MLHQGNRGNNIVKLFIGELWCKYKKINNIIKEQTKSRMAEILYHVII